MCTVSRRHGAAPSGGHACKLQLSGAQRSSRIPGLAFDHQDQRTLTPVAPTQFLFQVGDVSPVVREGLENFQPFVEVFTGGVVLDGLKEEGPENAQAVPLNTTSWVSSPTGTTGPLCFPRSYKKSRKCHGLQDSQPWGPFSFPQELAGRDRLGLSDGSGQVCTKHRL